jgi:hypothetical protein
MVSYLALMQAICGPSAQVESGWTTGPGSLDYAPALTVS